MAMPRVVEDGTGRQWKRLADYCCCCDGGRSYLWQVSDVTGQGRTGVEESRTTR